MSLLAPTTGVETPVPDAGLGTVPFAWSADGTHLLVGRSSSGMRARELYTWNRVTGAWTRILSSPVGNGAGIAAGPIRLVWHGPVIEGRAVYPAIWMSTEASDSTVVPDSKYGTEPGVSADGRTVIFSRPEVTGSKAETIYSFTLGESEAHPLARGSHPRFSRDGAWISFVRVTEGQGDVWIMRADGSAKRRVTRTGYDEESPAPSPDGRYVVYSSARGDEDQTLLYVARVSDGEEREVIHSGQNGKPVW